MLLSFHELVSSVERFPSEPASLRADGNRFLDASKEISGNRALGLLSARAAQTFRFSV
jgi:hypothetical protein